MAAKKTEAKSAAKAKTPQKGSLQLPSAQAPGADATERRSSWGANLLLPALAVFTGLVVGGVIIALSNDAAIAAWGNFFRNPLGALKASLDAVVQAYGALFSGALGRPADVLAGLQSFFATGDKTALYKAMYPFTESLVLSTPYIFAGLSVAVGFRCGLFNIGAEASFSWAPWQQLSWATALTDCRRISICRLPYWPVLLLEQSGVQFPDSSRRSSARTRS